MANCDTEAITSSSLLFTGKLHEKGLICECMISESVPDTLRGDATRFVQVLNNLLGRKYGRRCSA
jgi:signal transduction histidine kinase